MSINIKSDHADRLARELATLTGESLTDAITIAVAERLERKRADSQRSVRLHAIMSIAVDFAQLEVLDARHPDELIGYDENGLPT